MLRAEGLGTGTEGHRPDGIQGGERGIGDNTTPWDSSIALDSVFGVHSSADIKNLLLLPFPLFLQLNSKRLKAYKASLILFPRRTAKPKHGDSEAGELSMARQLKGKLMPITKETKPLEMVAVTEEMKGFKAYQKLRTERMNVWQVGPRIRKAEEAAKKAEEDAKVAKMK